MTTETETCKHWWVVPIGVAPVTATCKLCGAQKAFSNFFDDTVRPTSKSKRHATGYAIQGADLAAIPGDMGRSDGPR